MSKTRICDVCGEPFDREFGPMIVVCTPCLNKPAPPDAFVEQRGLFVPNQEVRK